jgi:hypothetical protein
MEQAEQEQEQAAELVRQQHQQDQERRRQEILAANMDPAWTARMLNRVLLGDGDKSDSESDSDLSSVATNVSALNPDHIPQKESVALKETPAREPGDNDNGRDDDNEDAEAAEEEVHADVSFLVHTDIKQVQTRLPSPLSNAIATLTYDENPADRPPWLTGLSKPLPHPFLTVLQDHEVITRFWDNEIARLGNLRAAKPPPEGQPADGEWTYEHFGSTMEVMKKQGNNTKEVTFARGKWTYVVDGEDVEVELDEWPLGLDGQPLGWGTHELADRVSEKALRKAGGLDVGAVQAGQGRFDGADERGVKEEEEGAAESGFEDEEVGETEDGTSARVSMAGGDVGEDVWGDMITIDDEE